MIVQKNSTNTSSVCTLITSKIPSLVTKEFNLDINGNLKKLTTAHLSNGCMNLANFNGLIGFASLLLGLKENQCLTYGCPNKSPVNLVTEKAWEAQGRPESSLPRSNKTFFWSEGPSILMLDYDAPKDGGQPLTKDELVSSLRNACPGLENASMLWWPSTSSCIYQGEKEHAGIKGQRLYLILKNGSDTPRAGAAILTYLWAAGIGRFEISKSGSFLERGLFDSSVWQPNRIDFAAGAKCHDGLEQRRGQPEIIKGDFEVIDSVALIPDPDNSLLEAAQSNKEIAKNLVAIEAINVRDAWVEVRVNEITKKNKSISKAQAETNTRLVVENNVLIGDWIITVQMNNGNLEEYSVAHILNNVQIFNGLLTLDPLEPDYDDTRLVGKLYLTGPIPNLHSKAHGGSTYKLVKNLQLIEIPKGNDRKLVDTTVSILRSSNDVFDFGPGVVVVGTNGMINQLNEHSFSYILGGKIQFYRNIPMRNGGFDQSLENPPLRLCKTILSLGSMRNLKKLDAVITAPTLRKDGSVLNNLGYDAQTKLLFDTNDTLPNIYNNPTKEQAFKALNQLLVPFVDFPFSTELDRAVHLAALLTSAVRPVLETAPAFAYDAPTQGSGKSLLARCVGVLATGKDPDIWAHTAGRDDEEVRKRLFTALISGSRALVWDNITETFDSAAMASLLTSNNYCDRVLGKSESTSVPNRFSLLLTGNNISLAGDLPRRVLLCRIDPQTENPHTREFDINPLAYCLQNRQEMIAAALTIIRFYITSADFINAKISRLGKGRLASFEEWDDWVRQTILYICKELKPNEFGDVMNKIQVNQINDPEQSGLGQLLRLMHLIFNDKKFMANEVIEKIQNEIRDDDCHELSKILKESSNGRGDVSSKSLGRIFSDKKDRIVSGLSLKQCGSINGTLLWQIKSDYQITQI